MHGSVRATGRGGVCKRHGLRKNPRNMPRICETVQEIELAQFHSKLSGCSILASSITCLQYRHQLKADPFFLLLFSLEGRRHTNRRPFLLLADHRPSHWQHEQRRRRENGLPCNTNLITAHAERVIMPPLQVQSHHSTHAAHQHATLAIPISEQHITSRYTCRLCRHNLRLTI